MEKIIPMIRCEDNARALAEHYVDIFPGAEITGGNEIVVDFSIFGQGLGALNGGPHESPNPSISFSLWIQDKALTRELRDKLSEGGEVLMPFDEYFRSPAYGRCNDKYGVSWQVMRDTREETTEHALIPSLMFTQGVAGKAQEAMEHYTTIFPQSQIAMSWPYGDADTGVTNQPHWLAHAEFQLMQQQTFIASDSGLEHDFIFNDGVSLLVSCKDQEEVDYYREKLILDGGKEVQCGRGKDRYGVSRQIIPVQLPEALFEADAEKAAHAMQAMLGMKKIVIEDLYMP